MFWRYFEKGNIFLEEDLVSFQIKKKEKEFYIFVCQSGWDKNEKNVLLEE